MKYVTKTTLRFRAADGKQMEISEGYIVSFDKGDQVDIDFLRRVGAIEVYEEPKSEPEVESQEVEPEVKKGGKRHARSTR